MYEDGLTYDQVKAAYIESIEHMSKLLMRHASSDNIVYLSIKY